MSRFPGVGQRVRQRLRALGYWKDGRPDVGRFCSERDYRPQYLEAIFRAFPDLYVWLDTEGRVLAYEGGSGGSFDVSLELARGKKIADVFPSASGLRLEAALRQFLDAPSPVSTEFALGAKRYEARLLPLPVESGAQRQLLMIVRDITERKQAEEATTAPARDVTTDPRVDLPAWLRERAAVEGHKSVVAVPLVSRGEVLGALSLASSTEREFSELELGLLTGFGATAALALENARRFHETEQGKALAQAAAAHSERRLRNLAQDLTAIVWEVDAATWRTIYVGHAAEKILGYPVERWYTEGDFWLSHLHPDDRVRFLTMRLEPVSPD